MAYVDADLVIHSMSEYQVVNKELEKYQTKLVQKLEAEKKSIANAKEKSAQQINELDVSIKSKQSEIETLEKKIRLLNQRATELRNEIKANDQ